MELASVLEFLQLHLGDLFTFLLIMVVMFAFRAIEKYLKAKQTQEELNVIEQLALQAVQFAEALGVTERLTITGLDKKSLAVDRLQKHLATLHIQADLRDIDEAIEAAWYREFYNQ